jgi:hypothetical protein
MVENMNQDSKKVENSGFRILGIIIVSFIFLILSFLTIGRIKGEYDNRHAKQSVEKLLAGLIKGNTDPEFRVKMIDGLSMRYLISSETISSNYSIELIDVDFGGYYGFKVSFDTGKQLIITMEEVSNKWEVFIKEQNKEAPVKRETLQ